MDLETHLARVLDGSPPARHRHRHPELLPLGEQGHPAAALGHELGQFEADERPADHDDVPRHRQETQEPSAQIADPPRLVVIPASLPNRPITRSTGDWPETSPAPVMSARILSPVCTCGRSPPGTVGRSARARRDDHDVRIQGTDRCGGGLGAESHIDAEAGDLGCEPLQQPFVVGGGEGREPQSPADPVALVHDGDAVPALGGDPRSLEPARTGTDHDDVLRRRSADERHERLVAQSRVDRADGRGVPEVLLHAYVAVDARADLFAAPLFQLGDERGIGQQLTAHRDEVRDALGDHPLADFRQHAADGDDGDGHRALDDRGVGGVEADLVRQRAVGEIRERVERGARDVEGVGAGLLEQHCGSGGFLDGQAVRFAVFLPCQAHDDGEAVADPSLTARITSQVSRARFSSDPPYSSVRRFV